MSGSENDHDVDRHAAATFFRRRPRVVWVVALIAASLLLALIGWGVTGRSNDEAAVPGVEASTAPTSPPAPTTVTTGAAVAARYGAMSIIRSSNGFTVTGQVPDDSTKALLPQSLRQAMPGAQIVDDLVATPGVTGPDIAGLGGLFGAALEIPGFSSKLVGDTVTLAGLAPTQDVKSAAADSVTVTWPNIKVVNDIRVKAAVPPPPTPVAPPGPTAGPVPPGAAPGGECGTLQEQLAGLLRTPITFATNGSMLTPESRRFVAQIAGKVKSCPTARLGLTGYADASGTDAINLPLSASRAKSVADALVSDGVAANAVRSSGAGSAHPLATNDTPQGRAQNRRVEITVG